MMGGSLTNEQRLVLMQEYGLQALASAFLVTLLVVALVNLYRDGRKPTNDLTAFALLGAVFYVFGTGASRVYFVLTFNRLSDGISLVGTPLVTIGGWIAVAVHSVSLVGIIMFARVAIIANAKTSERLSIARALIYTGIGILIAIIINRIL